MLIVPNKTKRELEEKKKAAADDFLKDKIMTVAHAYYTKLKGIKELWILFAAKQDPISGRIKMMIRAADKARKHEIDVPLQGGQLWYTNQTTGEARPEWILPLSARKQADDIDRVTEGNPLLKSYFKTASKKVGIDLLTGKQL